MSLSNQKSLKFLPATTTNTFKPSSFLRPPPMAMELYNDMASSTVSLTLDSHGRRPSYSTSSVHSHNHPLESSFSRLTLSHDDSSSSFSAAATADDHVFVGSNQDLLPTSASLSFQQRTAPRQLHNVNNGNATTSVMGFQNSFAYYPPVPELPMSYWESPDFTNPYTAGLLVGRNGNSRTIDSTESLNGKQNSLWAPGSGLYDRRPHWLQEPLKFLSLEGFKGRILSLATHQDGSRLLQQCLGSASVTREEIKVVFFELLDHVSELMVDPFGNFVLQKLVQVCSLEQRFQIVVGLTKKQFQLVRICLNVYGTRAVQTLLCYISTPQEISLAISALEPGTIVLTKDANGHHVIQHCLRLFSFEENKGFLNVMVDKQHCFDIARSKTGCCVLNQCLDHSEGELRDRLVNEIITNGVVLAENNYGNYVVQHVIESRIPQYLANMHKRLQGSYVALSRDKFGSHVVQKCLELMGEQFTEIILEILFSPEAHMMLVDPYGNFVFQTALQESKGAVYGALLELIQMNLPILRSNMYGKKVLDWLRKREQLIRCVGNAQDYYCRR